MAEKADAVSKEGWVYAVVCLEENNNHFLGLHNDEKDIDFIPVFESKDAANGCFLQLPREKGKKYEVQAVHIEELYEDAEKNGFAVAILDGEGSVVEK